MLGESPERCLAVKAFRHELAVGCFCVSFGQAFEIFCRRFWIDVTTDGSHHLVFDVDRRLAPEFGVEIVGGDVFFLAM